MTDTTDTSIALLRLVQNQAVKVTAATQQLIAVQHNGTTVASESTVDFEDGTNTTFTVVDDPANSRVKVTPVTAGTTIYRKLTSKTVNNTVTETDLLNAEISVGAGAMGANGLAVLTAWGDCLNNSGAGNIAMPRFKLKLGAGATVVVDTGAPATGFNLAAAGRKGWRIVAWIQNLALTNSQLISFGGTGGWGGGAANIQAALTTGEGNYTNNVGAAAALLATAQGFNTSAIDTTAAMAIVLSVILPESSVNTEMKLFGAAVVISP